MIKSFSNFILLLFCLINISTFGQNSHLTERTASRNGILKRYKPGTHLSLTYETDSSLQKIKGKFQGIVEDRVGIQKRKSEEKTFVPLENITAIKKIRPNRRLTYGIIGTALIGVGAVVIENGGPSPASRMKGALMIPVIGVGVYLLYTVPVSLLLEKINEKKRSKGWKFDYSQ